MSETIDRLYGGPGIDTSYEREQLTYRPTVTFSRDRLVALLRPETQQLIERSRTFTIAANLVEYDELIQTIDSYIELLEKRHGVDAWYSLKLAIEETNYSLVFSLEERMQETLPGLDVELYTMLHWMKRSLSSRRTFIDEYYRVQLSEESSVSMVEQKEKESIHQWEQLEAQVMDGYRKLAEASQVHEASDSHRIESSLLAPDSLTLTYEDLAKLEREKRSYELLHVSLADISYVHRNRYFFFLEALEKIHWLIHQPTKFIDKNMTSFMQSLTSLSSFASMKAHLLMKQKEYKNQHRALKGKIVTLEQQSETFGSEKQYLYQQLTTKGTESLKEWMFAQEESVSGALDLLNTYVVSSMKQSQSIYEETLGDLLNFYRSEAEFYEQQIYYLKEKEQIRQFYRILQDLEEAGQIQASWIEEYLKAKGYTT